MSGRVFGATLVAVLCMLSISVRADEPMRCGSSLITSQDSLATLLVKCGEPAKKDSRVEDCSNQGW
jgi:hypothetical protein